MFKSIGHPKGTARLCRLPEQEPFRATRQNWLLTVYFYNGYIYDKSDVVSLMPQLYDGCKRRGIGNNTQMKATANVIHWFN